MAGKSLLIGALALYFFSFGLFIQFYKKKGNFYLIDFVFFLAIAFTPVPKSVCNEENHELFIECGEKPCNSRTCASPVFNGNCTLDCKMNGDCICDDGFFRDECTRKCVSSLIECTNGAKISPFNSTNCWSNAFCNKIFLNLFFSNDFDFVRRNFFTIYGKNKRGKWYDLLMLIFCF